MMERVRLKDLEGAKPLPRSSARRVLVKAATTPKWNPDYAGVLLWRHNQCVRMQADPTFADACFEFYRDKPLHFINHWVDTVDPRNAMKPNKLVRMPFILFPAQERLVWFFLSCLNNENSGLVEKSRDMGATWVACAFSVWLWLYRTGAAIGWGSRKQELVDRLGDMGSIFEKIRSIVRGLPPHFLPQGFNFDKHSNFMRLRNPDNGAQITGEIGDDIGRGGRSLIYFKDESAHYAHPDLIEAALSENTRVQIDISSVNTTANVFYQRRDAGIEWNPSATMKRGRTWVLVLDWRDNPMKSQAWYNARRAKFESEGLLHVFKQEIDRNYNASLSNTLISDEWVTAAIDADKKLKLDLLTGGRNAGLDVADGGVDLNALAITEGVTAVELAEWGERDTAVTTRRAVDMLKDYAPLKLQYDSAGIGSGVKAEINSLRERGELPPRLGFQPWNGGAKVLHPKGRVIKGDASSALNEDFFHNLKAQAWWSIRMRLYRTWRYVTQGVACDPSLLICLPSDLPFLRKLQQELCQVIHRPSGRNKLLVDKAPGSLRSPNLADALVMAYFPIVSMYSYDTSMNWVGQQ